MLQNDPHATTPAPQRMSGLLVALGPFAIALFTFVAAPRYFGHAPPSALGVPLPFILTLLAVGWSALGGYIVATNRRAWVLPAALLVFTVPAIFMIVLGPAVILMLQNLPAD